MSEDNKESPPAIQGTQETSLQSSASATEESIVENINLSIPDDKKLIPHHTFQFALSTWSKLHFLNYKGNWMMRVLKFSNCKKFYYYTKRVGVAHQNF